MSEPIEELKGNEPKREKVRIIPVELIDDFPDHPFQVKDDESMAQLVSSIEMNGVLNPVILRKKEGERYEIIAGHRRKYACRKLDIKLIPSIVRELSREDAIIEMVDSNLQRECILPSEKARAYKMKMDAMKRKAGRPSKENSVPLGQNFGGKTSREILAETSPDSNTQIQRYIRLTELIPKLLEMVDEKLMSFRPAVEVSYLTTEEQEYLLDSIQVNECTPSLAQALRLKQYSQEGRLSAERIENIMSEEKPVERKLVLDGKWVTKYFSKEMTPKEIISRIEKALELLERTEKKRLER